ncbi:MAG: LapA family protein [Candidatus Cloacimonadales bacterium]
MKAKTITLLVLVALFIILVMQNSAPVKINIYFWSIHMSGIILFPAILIVGVIIGYILAKVNSQKRHNRQAEKSDKK